MEIKNLILWGIRLWGSTRKILETKIQKQKKKSHGFENSIAGGWGKGGALSL